MSKIQLRRGTTAQWEEFNPILAEGELGLDLTQSRLKVGNGVDAWEDLPFVSISSVDDTSAAAVGVSLNSHLTGPTNRHIAAQIAFTPTGNVSSTDVQSAIAELESEKASFNQLDSHLIDATDAHDASAISVTPISTQLPGDDVQEVLVQLNNKALSGISSARPLVTGWGVRGVWYFDTTRNKPIFWNGASGVWVDATGATIP